jgi:uncharacterized membrane protein
MKGKILSLNNGSGIIVCDAGDRYEFENGEIKSERVKNGSMVDFIAEGNKAKEIYIIAEAGASAIIDDMMSTADSIRGKATDIIESKSGGSAITKLGFLAAAGMIVSFIGAYTFDLLFYIGFGIELYAVFMLSRSVSVDAIFRNRIKSYVSLIIALLLLDSAVSSAMIGMMSSDSSSFIFTAIKAILAISLMIYSALSAYKALSVLSKIFENKFFFYAAWMYIAGAISPIYALTGDYDLALRLPYILFSLHFILMFIGYVNLKEPKAKELEEE